MDFCQPDLGYCNVGACHKPLYSWYPYHCCTCNGDDYWYQYNDTIFFIEFLKITKKEIVDTIKNQLIIDAVKRSLIIKSKYLKIANVKNKIVETNNIL